ncbi:MAG: hypothetical protein HEQ14_03805 [Aphanizomenon flos-aquae CP01]|jgi:hypothetical protein|nr:hypothetical protein [Aphanizomenon flos-aquae CP01]
MDFTWVKRKDCKVLLQDSTLVVMDKLFLSLIASELIDELLKQNLIIDRRQSNIVSKVLWLDKKII